MAESLRVLLVTVDYPPPPGGIQTIVKNLEGGLEQLGHEVTVLHVNRGDFDWSVTDLVPRPRWYYSLDGITSRDHVYMNTVYREATEAIESYNPDVVHAMHVKDWPAIVAANEHNVPSVLSTYALELRNTPLASRAVRDADIIHALTEFTESLVLDVGSIDTRTRIIPPSIDVEAYQRTEVEIGQDERGPVVTLSRFVDRKNIETVINAWDRLGEDVRDGRELIVAGDGPNRSELERAASGMSDVRFPGWVNGDAKRELLASADVFAMVPRRNGYDVEGFGIVYIEAQASRTPVVGSKHGGAPEAIDGAGIVVDDENDPDEVSRAIRSLLLDNGLRQRKLSSAESRVSEFGLTPVAERHVKMYDDIH